MLAGRPTDRRACVVCNIYETWGIYHAYAEQPSGTLVALIGSSGRLELAIGRRQRRPAAGHRRRHAGDAGVGMKGVARAALQSTTYPAHAVCRCLWIFRDAKRHTACAGYVSGRERLRCPKILSPALGLTDGCARADRCPTVRWAVACVRMFGNIPELDLSGEPRYSTAPRILVQACLIGQAIHLFGVDHGCITFRDGLVGSIGERGRLAAASPSHEGSVHRHAATDRRLAGRGLRRRQRLAGRAGRGRGHGSRPGPAARRGLRRRAGQPRAPRNSTPWT